VRKHAQAKKVWIQSNEHSDNSWSCIVEDDGVGIDGDPFRHQDRYGLKIMNERAAEMGWVLQIQRDHGKTKVEIRKEVS
jgi:nitrate/nitrite-specific signal transduction histidine kinase